jgi:hypothetical protein
MLKSKGTEAVELQKCKIAIKSQKSLRTVTTQAKKDNREDQASPKVSPAGTGLHFIRASARFGRHETEKIALDVGRLETEVREFATAFWGKGKVASPSNTESPSWIERREED